MKKDKKTKHISPYKKLINSFIIIILLGSLLLYMPFSSTTGKSVDFLTCLFTATSAVAVTGLSVVDVSKTFTVFGQIVIVVLIQLGGLGIMTFSSVFILLLGRKMSYSTKKIIREDLNYDSVFEIQKFVKRIVRTVFIIEFVGATFLFLVFVREMGVKKGLFFAVFHSVSAFCNAGFSLFTTGLEGYYSNVIVNTTISSLIFMGGIGFVTINAVYELLKRNKRKFPITSKLSLQISAWLIFIGAFIMFVLEYNNSHTIGTYSLFNQIQASVFQSVSTRTAGFNTIPIGSLRDSTLLFFIVLMLIGASPGSTGGGVKTTTVGVVLYGVIATLFNNRDIEIKNRRIPWETFNRAITIIIISLIYVISITFFLVILEKEKRFIEIFFEVVSAFATVGLSTGITADLGFVSRVLIIITMFIGRVGPLTVAMSLTDEGDRKGVYRYPSEDVLVG